MTKLNHLSPLVSPANIYVFKAILLDKFYITTCTLRCCVCVCMELKIPYHPTKRNDFFNSSFQRHFASVERTAYVRSHLMMQHIVFFALRQPSLSSNNMPKIRFNALHNVYSTFVKQSILCCCFSSQLSDVETGFDTMLAHRAVILHTHTRHTQCESKEEKKELLPNNLQYFMSFICAAHVRKVNSVI